MEFMKQYTDSFLFEAFDDIIKWRNTGIVDLKSNIRKVVEDYIKIYSNIHYDTAFNLVESFILTELARRYKENYVQ
jgi:hypothetical protein